MKVLLDDDDDGDDDDEIINDFQRDHDEITTFSLEKTSDQIKSFLVVEDLDELLFHDDYEYHQMDSNQNLNLEQQINFFMKIQSFISCQHSTISFSPTFITRRVHLSRGQ